MNFNFRFLAAVSVSSLMMFGCGPNDGGRSNYTRVGGETVLKSSTLSNQSLARKTESSRAQLDSLINGYETYYYLTPSNMSGKILQAYLMVGKLGGDGPGGTALMLLAHGQGYEKSTVPTTDLLWDFDFKDPVTWSTDFTCCGDHYPPDEDAKPTILEMLFGYIDVDFIIAEGTLQGNHTVRIVYATIEDQGLRQGDVLYKTENGFAWWDSTKQSDGLTLSRPSNPVQNNFALKKNTPDTQRGNRYIQSLSAFIPDSMQFTMPADTVLNNTWSFEVDFIVNRCVSFLNRNPEQMSSIRELMSSIDITANGFDIREMQGEKVGLAARVIATKTPVANE